MVVVSLQKGDFVAVDYTARVKETGEVFDTTLEDVAKKEHLYKEGEVYEPKLVVVGEGWVLKALDESLVAMEVAKASKVEIPQDKAFGARDPEKVKRVPLRQLTAKGVTPGVGMRVEYGEKMATVRAVGAGRVLLDFNPPLAGKTLVYEVTVRRKLDKREEKVRALIHRRTFAVDESKFKFALKLKALTVDMPEEAFYVEGIQVAKRGIAMDVQKFFPDVTSVRFVETFKFEPKRPSLPAKAETGKVSAKKSLGTAGKAEKESKAES
jgi:peptidylprolyl isomerase